MQAALKGLYSDVTDLKTYCPTEENNFGVLVRVMVGPMDGQGEESFEVFVCTPRWLSEKYSDAEILLGLHKLIVFRYDYMRIQQFIEKYLMRCTGDSWHEIALKVNLLGRWEFEDYRANPR
jgi:hypothetical protein